MDTRDEHPTSLGNFPSRELSVKWFGDQIPDLEGRAALFLTDLNVVDEELLELFATEIDGAVTGLFTAVDEKDVAAIREYAHTLQGMGGTVGAPEISVLGDELSLRARAADFSRCRHLLAAFQGWRTEWITPNHPSSGLTHRMPRLYGKLLVVDDERANRRFLEKLLGDCGADVKLAENGEQALEMILKHRPDVALVDVMMPGIDGYEVCRRVCASPDLCQTLVIMVTAKSTVEDIEHAFLQGAFDYIRKPFHSRELLARVRNALQLKQNTDALRSWQTRMSRELEMAGAVQAKLFNPLPLFGRDFDVYMAYQPSEHVGGDMFDLHPLPDGRLLGYVADVAGHGVAASLISTLIKGLITEIIFSLHLPPLHMIVNELHRRFRGCVQEPEIYATLLLFRVDPVSRQVESISCGHPAPIFMGGDGRVLPELSSHHGGMPIGMMPAEFGAPYTAEDENGCVLPSGAVFFGFTDGLVEARDTERNEIGAEGLQAVLADYLLRSADLPEPERVLSAISARGYAFQTDDCTLMQIQIPQPEDILAAGGQPLSLREVDALSVMLSDTLAADGWDAESVMMVRLLVMEHGTNVVKHGRVHESDPLFYRLTRHPRGAVLVFADPGCAWVDHRDRRHPDGMDESGRGLDLIRSIAPVQRSFRRDNRNHVVYLLDRQLSQRLLADLEPPEIPS